jgi:hypothetical protein
MKNRKEILKLITKERDRQSDLPGSEWDTKNTPGDWVAIVSHYVSAEVRRNGQVPEAQAFEDNLVKAAAVIMATLENLATMRSRGELQ